MKNKITYNKLIRDKIPEIIEKNGKQSMIHIADEQEYKSHLLLKLIEEAKELQVEPCIEELADIIEVILSIKNAFNFTDEAIEAKRLSKKEARGGFEDKLILEYVYEA